jgi:hypothetical protein
MLGQDALEEYIEEAQVEDLYNDSMFYGEGQMDTNLDKKIRDKNETAKMLVHAATLMEIVDDYSQLQNITGNDDVFLNRSKAKLADVKAQLKKAGYNVETQDDVFNTLSMSEEGGIIQQLINRTLDPEQQSLSLQDHIESYMGMLRERELAEFNFAMQSTLFDDFIQDPSHQISMWENRIKSDEQLEAILEEDYVNTIRDYESAAAREVKDNDIYVGNDGYWYITKKVGDKFEKHRYHPRSRKIDDEALSFNPLEYDQAKKSEEAALKKQQATKKANENVQTGNVTTEPQIEPQEEVEAAPTEAPEEIPESPDTIHVGDYVTT